VNTLREDLDKARETPSSITGGVAYQLLLSAWSASSHDNTQDVYHTCALDIIVRPDVYPFETCTKGLSTIHGIMDKRHDELDILNGHAQHNIMLSNRTYNKAILTTVENMSPTEKKERTVTLCDSEFLIKEILQV
jgi:hypothetical protein